MADPVTLTLAAISIGSAAAGAATSAGGAAYTAKAQAAMYNYQAGVALANKQVASEDANYALESGEVEAQQAGLRGRAQVGGTKVAYGAGNIDTSTGSASRVLSSETEINQQNEGIIRANAVKRAFGFNVQGAEDVAQAGAYRTAAGTSLTAGNINVASSIIGGVGNVSSKWLSGTSSGIFPSFGGTTGGVTTGADADA